MRTLDQSQIDALFAKAQQSQGTIRSAPKKTIEPFDLRPKQLNSDQLSSLTALHEALARRLTYSLAAHLRVNFAMTLSSVQQLTYSDFLVLIPEMTYFASVHVMPLDVRAAMQLDIALAYPIIDVALGGSGSDSFGTRDLTEIEEQVLESVFRLILVDLQATWAPVLDLDFQFEQRQRALQLQTTMQAGEKVLCLTFECHVAEFSGNLMMAFPAVIANGLVRRLSAQWASTQRIPSRHARRYLREQLLESSFNLDLSLPDSQITIRQLVDLAPGYVLPFPLPARDPIHLNVAGVPMFLAYPVRHNTKRGARIEQRLAVVDSKKRAKLRYGENERS
jgi:flagellar motor switch protein FliM